MQSIIIVIKTLAFTMATKDTQKPGGGGGIGLGVSRFATDGPNPFYGGPLDPRHRDPA